MQERSTVSVLVGFAEVVGCRVKLHASGVGMQRDAASPRIATPFACFLRRVSSSVTSGAPALIVHMAAEHDDNPILGLGWIRDTTTPAESAIFQPLQEVQQWPFVPCARLTPAPVEQGRSVQR